MFRKSQTSDRDADTLEMEIKESEVSPLVPTTTKRKHSDDDAGSLSSSNDHIYDETPPPALPKLSTYEPWVAVVFTLNYSIGSGVLNIPLDYYHSGYILGSLILILMSGLTYCTYIYIVDGMRRAEAIATLAAQQNLPTNILRATPEEIIESLQGTSAETLQASFRIHRNEFQLQDLLGIFCGNVWKVIYEITFHVGQFTSMWSYSALFGISLVRVIGIEGISATCSIEDEDNASTSSCRNLYSLYVAIFWVWNVFVSLLDFTEQQGIQIAFCIARFGVIMVMAVTSIGLMYSVWVYTDDEFIVNTDVTIPHYGSGHVRAWKWGYFLYMFAVAAFAQGSQYCVTDVVTPLHVEGRKHLYRVFFYATYVACALYIFVGISVSTYFGSEITSPCTLLWAQFPGWTQNSGGWFVECLDWVVVLFPALDVMSAFPINCITWANILAPRIPNVLFECCPNVNWIVVLKIVICTMCALMSLLIWNFDFVVTLSGAATIFALYTIPALMEYYSRRMCYDITGDENAHVTTPGNSWAGHPALLWGTVCFSFAAFIGIIYELITW